MRGGARARGPSPVRPSHRTKKGNEWAIKRCEDGVCFYGCEGEDDGTETKLSYKHLTALNWNGNWDATTAF